MTREETKQLLPILQAFAEGKVIQYKDQGVWRDITMEEGLFVENAFVNVNDYRIKPSPTYRPFANTEECWNEMLKHEPFGWVINKKHKTKHNITLINIDGSVVIPYEDDRTKKGAFEDFTFADGSAFGVKCEED